MDEHSELTDPAEQRATRRGSLLTFGGLLAGAITGGAAALGETDAADAAGAGPAAVASGLLTCVLAPEQMEGPYFTPRDRVRRDVTERKPGVPLALGLAVVDASRCKPIKNAAVDIWQCDALGVYSGFADQDTEGQTYLRGIQRTDARGVARFRTIYPGWYPGRTVHIHVRVFLGGNIAHTGQLYFPEQVTDAVMKRAPYSTRPDRDQTNEGDFIFRNGGSRSMLRVAKSGRGYVGAITMGVLRS